MAGYLFVHFIGEQKNGEQIYFSLSKDGLYWKDLNFGSPVLFSKIGEKGVRDPFLVKDEKNSIYYLIATDLCIAQGKGWGAAQNSGSRDIIIWESKDLIHWSNERSHTVGIPKAGCVWAPEAIYDEEKQAFFLFWASKVQKEGETERKHRIYACYTKDFKIFSETFEYIERDRDVIDTTIVREKEYYYRFSKDETTSRIHLDRSKSLTGEFEIIESKVLEELGGVEGPECYLLPDEKTWCLIVDRFAEGKGYLPLLTDDLSSGVFQVMDQESYDMGKNKKRHGGVLKLTDKEYERLEQAFLVHNPVLEGLFADPDIAVFDGTYYIYPTTDGFEGWSGTKFYVFSSKDGIHYKKENLILDIAGEQVPWAVGCAWAPCIVKKDEMYYFYFCAKDKTGSSCIGVAYANTPTGPFTAIPEPLVTMEQMKQYKIKMGQTIDPSIYTEGKENYLLFGNGYPAIVKLSEDMCHLEFDTLRNLEGAFEFREAITVLKRDALYHFTWSCDDTGSEEYHVNYGTAKELYGPIQYEYPILVKEKEQGILGTGHHSIVKVPEEDSYRIAYHRFATPLEKYPQGKGYHRETCISALNFGSNGKMEKVQVNN